MRKNKEGKTHIMMEDQKTQEEIQEQADNIQKQPEKTQERSDDMQEQSGETQERSDDMQEQSGETQGWSDNIQEQSRESQPEELPGVLPEGEALYEVDVHVNASALYDYFLRHVYTTFSGMIGTIIGVFMVMVYFMKGISILYLICGIIIILYLPWSLYLTAKKQSLQETFKNPLHYAFYENGVEVSQGETRQMQKWEDMIKAVSTSKSIIIYTGKNSASIFPRKDLGENAQQLIRIIFTHMDSKKVKIKA